MVPEGSGPISDRLNERNIRGSSVVMLTLLVPDTSKGPVERASARTDGLTASSSDLGPNCSSKEKATSAAVIIVPLWNSTPWRTLKVQVKPSGVKLQDSAKDEIISLPSLPWMKKSWSNRW